jgi:SAM-dependent methyltransferase
MSSDLEFTGERFVPGVAGEIAHEHWHRYAFARRFCAGRRVADIACGEGYGSALLAAAAEDVVGIDIEPATIAHAARRYAVPNLRFVAGSADALPLPGASIDAIVSFETIEHLPADAQPRMLAEFARVLAPGGFLLLSSPNRPEYSDARQHVNPFHLHELDREELARLFDAAFPARRWYRQRRYLGSALWAEEGGDGFEALAGDAQGATAAPPPQALYFIVIAARTPDGLPASGPALSLFTDAAEREWQRIDAQAREVLRLDALLAARDAALAHQTAHIAHLEELVAYRDRIVVQRDAELQEQVQAREALARDFDAHRAQAAKVQTALGSAQQAVAALDAERLRLERALEAQDRIINYRQSARWWLQLPWLRVRLAWRRVTGALG